jgi:hypothetical protein
VYLRGNQARLEFHPFKREILACFGFGFLGLLAEKHDQNLPLVLRGIRKNCVCAAIL